MILLLALTMTGDLASGCRTIGSTVRCELAAPEAVKPSAPQSVTPKPVAKTAVVDRAHRARGRVRGVVESGSPNPIIDDATIRQHIASLVAIGDCTGARTYANLIGKVELADQSFNGCVGLASAAPTDSGSAP